MDSFFGIGVFELFVIAVIALLVMGPERLPGAMREIAKYIRQLRNISNEFQSQFSDELKMLDELNPKRILNEALDPNANPAPAPKPGTTAAKATTATAAAKPAPAKPAAAKPVAPKATPLNADGEPSILPPAAGAVVAQAAQPQPAANAEPGVTAAGNNGAPAVTVSPPLEQPAGALGAAKHADSALPGAATAAAAPADAALPAPAAEEPR